jgi:hypothetical protein
VGRPKGDGTSIQFTAHVSEEGLKRLKQAAFDHGVNIGKIVDFLLLKHLPGVAEGPKAMLQGWGSPTSGPKPYPSIGIAEPPPLSESSTPNASQASNQSLQNFSSPSPTPIGKVLPPIAPRSIKGSIKPKGQASTVPSLSPKPEGQLDTTILKARMMELGINRDQVGQAVGVVGRAVGEWFEAQRIPPKHIPTLLGYLKRLESAKKRIEKKNS